MVCGLIADFIDDEKDDISNILQDYLLYLSTAENVRTIEKRNWIRFYKKLPYIFNK
jgi:hypothetical protein